MGLHLQIDTSGNSTIPAAGKLKFANSADTFFSTFKAGVNTYDIDYTLPIVVPTASQVLQVSSVTGSGPYNVVLNWATVSGGGGVSSVGLSLPAIFTVSGSPVTSTGTLTGTLASQTANTFFVAPDGSSGAPTFRAMLNADLPTSAVSPASYTYSSITVNSKGIVTAASNGAQPLVTLNTLTGATQTFAVGTSGTDFAISSSSTTHTFNIPSASAANRGLVTTGTQTIGGLKTFADGVDSSKKLTGGVVALTDAATIAVDASLGNTFRVTLGGNRTMGVPTNPTNGQRIMFEIIQDGTGSRTITFSGGAGGFSYGTDITGVTLTTTASKRDFVGAVYNSTANTWYIIAFVKGY